MPDSNKEPIIILQGLDTYDDTIFTLCHWHFEPEQAEIDAMIDTVDDKDGVEFFVSRGRVTKQHEYAEDATNVA